MGISRTPILDDERCECCGKAIKGEHPDHPDLCTDCNDLQTDFPLLTDDEFD